VTNNPQVAIAIYSSEQPWGTQKRGLQVTGTSRLVPDNEVTLPIGAYGARFSTFPDILADNASLQGLESRFFEFRINNARVFDEPRFGSEVWIDASFEGQ
jgi:hypothetical protein